MNHIKEKVHELYYDYNVNCARTTLKLLAETFDIQLEKQTYNAAIGMHGAGKFGAQCGLVEGGLIFLGIYLEGKLSDNEISTICYSFAQKFTERFGSLTCDELRPDGFNDDDPPHLCEEITGEAIEFIIGFVEDLQIKEMNGGNVNHVVRVGDTVRRESEHSLYAEQLLLHLESKDFHKAPRFMGRDDLHREILSFIEGDIPGNDYPNEPMYMWSDEALVAIAKLLKDYHEATLGFTCEEGSDMAYPDASKHEVVCHNDFTFYNAVFNEELPTAIIDFDLAGPGPRLWDIAYTLYTSVPLASFQPDMTKGKIVDYDFSYEHLREKRIELFFEAYGIPVPKDLKRWVIKRIEKVCDTLLMKAREGNEAYITMIEDGHLEHYEREIEFLKKHFPCI